MHITLLSATCKKSQNIQYSTLFQLKLHWQINEDGIKKLISEIKRQEDNYSID